MMTVSLKHLASPLLWKRKQVITEAQLPPVSRRMSTAVKLGVAALLLGVSMLVSALGIMHLNGVVAKPLEQKQPTKSVSAPAAAPATCKNAQSENVVVFTTCPSFAPNFTSQRGGTISNNDFTIYTGAPEANQEAQLYTNSPKNLRIENGSLLLQAQYEPQQGYQYTSARIDTHGKKNFLYGKFSIRAQVPAGVGTWPAIWMLPSQPRYASLSPVGDYNRYLNDGEIDILEAVGTEPHRSYGIAHSRAYPSDGPDRSYYSVVNVADSDTAFHDYGVEWTPTNLTFTIDGQAYYSYTKKAGADYTSWPFDQPYYLIFNLALGGSWGGTAKAQFPGDGVDKSALPATLKIQSVRYYPYIGK